MRNLICSIAIFATLTTSALAADNDFNNGASVPASYDWSGFYIGLGLVGSRFSDTDTLFPGFTSTGDGVNAIGHAGVNVQLDSFIFGVEADYTKLNADFDVRPAVFQSIEITDMASVRARIGYAMDRIMFYGTAGVGYAEANVTAFTGLAAPATVSTKLDGYGTVLGLGLDYALTDNIILGVQYQHHNYDNFGKGNTLPGQVIDAEFDSLTARLSFKF